MAAAVQDPAESFGLVVVGAGPCALAVLSRLVRDCRCAGIDERPILRCTRVLDPAGEWLGAWRRKLGAQAVSHLRSPTFVHPHPSRVIDDELGRFARRHNRLHELLPLPTTDGDGLLSSPHAPHEWHAPSVALFDDFCAAMIAEYGLADLVSRGEAVEVRPDGRGGALVVLARGQTLRARAVVLAVGNGGTPVVPRWACGLVAGAGGGEGQAPVVHSAWLPPPEPRGLLSVLTSAAVGLVRAAAAAVPLPGVRPALRPAARSLLIVGGGLSAAQLALMAAREAPARFSDVYLCARRPIRERPYDISSAWMGRHWGADFAPEELGFFRAGLEERAHVLSAARDGGSVTPSALAQLRWLHAAARHAAPSLPTPPWAARLPLPHALRAVLARAHNALCARVHVLEGCEVVDASALDRAEQDARVRVRLRHSRTLESTPSLQALDVHTVWLATGHRVDVPAPCVPVGDPLTSACGGASADGPAAHAVDAEGPLSPATRTGGPSLHAELELPNGVEASAQRGLLSSVQRHWPAPVVAGLPVLTPTLQWAVGAPVYACGSLTALQLGPDAFNLAGAAAGASRIVSDLLSHGAGGGSAEWLAL